MPCQERQIHSSVRWVISAYDSGVAILRTVGINQVSEHNRVSQIICHGLSTRRYKSATEDGYDTLRPKNTLLYCTYHRPDRITYVRLKTVAMPCIVDHLLLQSSLAHATQLRLARVSISRLEIVVSSPYSTVRTFLLKELILLSEAMLISQHHNYQGITPSLKHKTFSPTYFWIQLYFRYIPYEYS